MWLGEAGEGLGGSERLSESVHADVDVEEETGRTLSRHGGLEMRWGGGGRVRGSTGEGLGAAQFRRSKRKVDGTS